MCVMTSRASLALNYQTPKIDIKSATLDGRVIVINMHFFRFVTVVEKRVMTVSTVLQIM